jgi:hypothetical protein
MFKYEFRKYLLPTVKKRIAWSRIPFRDPWIMNPHSLISSVTGRYYVVRQLTAHHNTRKYFKPQIRRLLYLFIWLEWNRVHYYWDNLLAYCTTLGWYMVMIVGKWVEWVISNGNRSTCRNPALLVLCSLEIPWLDPGSNPSRRVGKPATNCLRTAYLDDWDPLDEGVSHDLIFPVCFLSKQLRTSNKLYFPRKQLDIS